MDWREESDCGGYESLIGSHIGLRGFTCSSNTIELDTCLEIREIRERLELREIREVFNIFLVESPRGS